MLLNQTTQRSPLAAAPVPAKWIRWLFRTPTPGALAQNRPTPTPPHAFPNLHLNGGPSPGRRPPVSAGPNGAKLPPLPGSNGSARVPVRPHHLGRSWALLAGVCWGETSDTHHGGGGQHRRTIPAAGPRTEEWLHCKTRLVSTNCPECSVKSNVSHDGTSSTE